ncbi:adenine phosphoribosyltransferase-like isoform X1 [Buteo buteo]|uniref:adenine phosphoribosyltransferase-like isoform X1 n=1 Tax=Buteo buteo TaxID=30397 RepID=UPI003EBE700B
MPRPRCCPPCNRPVGTAEPGGGTSLAHGQGSRPGTGPGPSWPRVLAGAQRHRGCPRSAVAVCDAPRDGPARLNLAAGTQCLRRRRSPRMDLCHVPATREKGWYLALMAPNVKGPNYAWLDPSRLYCHPQGLQDCVADLLQPFQGDPIDMVAGIDAMGFILGAAAAAILQKGFLAIRKAGHLCVQTLTQPYTDYSGREKVMEVRTDAISPGLRILLVDQWVETGGTMRAAIQLVERLGGVVAGVAAICIEDSEGGRWIQEHYKCAHCVPPRLQPRFDRHQLGWD